MASQDSFLANAEAEQANAVLRPARPAHARRTSVQARPFPAGP